ncbi:hypothetical protein GO986_18630 [Deinococcus sp. HMF7620]|uniref:Uncharacterized protein n=1 Tax=Deinococcus arboris TaxID=2682977 RepID=A0A7C9LN74_9DEIO|nr:hypothetical protein [Deinococcus arboris]MVN88758.1 hypothetical protein [Deinococcus arboris]
MSEWTKTELAVLHAVRTAAALTSRRVQQDHGPRPNWHRLLENDVLKEVSTVYGPVLTLTERAHDFYEHTGRLRGPGSLADRAYMLDAVRMLEQKGYSLMEYDYKRGPERGTTTGHITRARMGVPPEELRRIHAYWGPERRQGYAPSGRREEQKGEVWLYARCSGGGVQATELRRLLKRHLHDISTWRSPMLIVVPQEVGPLRTFARGHMAKDRALHESMREKRLAGMRDAPYTPDFLIFEQPLPSLVYRPSRAKVGHEG